MYFFHTSQCMRKNRVCVGNSHCPVQPVTTSHKYKLYSEVYTGSRGQKPYAPNVAIHVGLQDSTLGNTKLRHIQVTTNTPSPSRRGMQKDIQPDCHNYFSVHD